MDNVSPTSQDLLEGVSPTTLYNDTKTNPVERWVIVSTSQYDQPPLSQDAEAGVETRTGATESDNRLNCHRQAKCSCFFRHNFRHSNRNLHLLRPLSFSITAAPVVVVPSGSDSTPPSMPLASQTLIVPLGHHNFNNGPSAQPRQPEVHHFFFKFCFLSKLTWQIICLIRLFRRKFIPTTFYQTWVPGRFQYRQKAVSRLLFFHKLLQPIALQLMLFQVTTIQHQVCPCSENKRRFRLLL